MQAEAVAWWQHINQTESKDVLMEESDSVQTTPLPLEEVLATLHIFRVKRLYPKEGQLPLVQAMYKFGQHYQGLETQLTTFLVEKMSGRQLRGVPSKETVARDIQAWGNKGFESG